MAPLPGKRCSWCGGPFNGGNCRHCTNVSFGDEFVHPLEEGERCQRCTCKWCGYGLSEGSCWICPSRDENSSIDAPNSFNDLTNVFTHLPQPQYESYFCELCGNNSHYSYDCPPRFPLNVPEDNAKIYSNPLFEFDDEYISSDVNPLFDEVLDNIESKDSYVSNLDELALLVKPLSDFNEDEFFDPSGDVDEIEFLLHHDPSTPTISVASILEGFTDEPPLEENDDLFDLESKENEWKKILYDAPINNLKSMVKVFDPGIHETKFSPTYDCPDYEDSRARGLVHRSLDLQSLACLYMGI
ncbi:hypothetical protein Tco_1343824 [Tanacetum coccineum]